MTFINILIFFKFIFIIISVVFGILAAFFGFYQELQDGKHNNIQKWFEKKWATIKQSKWLSLPEKIIWWFLSLRKNITKKVMNSLDDASLFTKIWGILLFFGSIIIMAVLVLIRWGVFAILIYILFSLPVLYDLISSFNSKLTESKNKLSELLEIYFNTFCILHFSLLSIFIILQILKLSIITSFLLLILLLPFYWFIILIPILPFQFIGKLVTFKKDNDGDFEIEYLVSISLAVAISFPITYLAFIFGNIANPNSWIPNTLQMLISNVIFDGSTFATTFFFLSKAVKGKNSFFKIPLAIIKSVIFASIFACLSLLFGLIFTSKAISIKESMQVLFAHSADGKHLDIGPYFWVMHTTFIPILIFLIFILITWTCKAILIPVKYFFEKGKYHSNPLKLTSALFTLLTAISICIVQILKYITS